MVDFLTKKRVKNNGIIPQYYVENSHEPIIPRNLYMQVQEEMVRRVNLHSGEKRKKRVYSSKYALLSIVYCPKCEGIYRRIAWNNRGKRSTVWRCCTRVEHGTEQCDAPTIQESELQDLMAKAINDLLGGRDTFLPILRANILQVLAQDAERDGQRKHIEEMKAFLEEQKNIPVGYDEQLVRRLVAKERYC